jgi:hypothetical protein
MNSYRYIQISPGSLHLEQCTFSRRISRQSTIGNELSTSTVCIAISQGNFVRCHISSQCHDVSLLFVFLLLFFFLTLVPVNITNITERARTFGTSIETNNKSVSFST